MRNPLTKSHTAQMASVTSSETPGWTWKQIFKEALAIFFFGGGGDLCKPRGLPQSKNLYNNLKYSTWILKTADKVWYTAYMLWQRSLLGLCFLASEIITELSFLHNK